MQRGRGRPPGAKNKVPPEAKAKSPKSPKMSSKLLGNTEVPKSPKSAKNGPIYHNAHKLHLAQEKAKALAAATASMASASMASASMTSISTASAPRGRFWILTQFRDKEISNVFDLI